MKCAILAALVEVVPQFVSSCVKALLENSATARRLRACAESWQKQCSEWKEKFRIAELEIQTLRGKLATAYAGIAVFDHHGHSLHDFSANETSYRFSRTSRCFRQPSTSDDQHPQEIRESRAAPEHQVTAIGWPGDKFNPWPSGPGGRANPPPNSRLEMEIGSCVEKV